MCVVRKSIKDFCSSVVELVEAKVRAFAERPKREDRKLLGREYSDFLLSCLSSEAGKEIEDSIVFRENCAIDFIWQELSLGMEAKRLIDTKFRNDGHARAWLKQEFIERFIDYERETGQNLTTRILCVSEKKWSKQVDEWLTSMGYYLIETGQIDTLSERTIAETSFISQFTDVLCEVCRGVRQIAN